MNFVNVDAKQLYEKIIVKFQNALGQVLYPGDERRIFLEQEAQIIVAMYNAINDSARQNLLMYARGEVLDAIGKEYDTYRLPAQKAECIVKFTLSSAQMASVTIPRGTRVTPDGNLFFETTVEQSITPGQVDKDIRVVATIIGEAHNAFTPGQVKTLVDTVPFISSVSNTTITSGGAEQESDDNGVDVWSGYRERIRLSTSKMSTAGHEMGYIYHAKSADANIQDVKVTSPNPGEILITVLMKNGEIPTQVVLDRVLNACGSKEVRPMTDKVSAQAPTGVEYGINLTYYIAADNLASEVIIKETVNKAVEQYIQWQGSKLGTAINPDYLKQLILNAGAYKVDITSPVYTELNDTSVASFTTKTITYGGLKG